MKTKMNFFWGHCSFILKLTSDLVVADFILFNLPKSKNSSTLKVFYAGTLLIVSWGLKDKRFKQNKSGQQKKYKYLLE